MTVAVVIPAYEAAAFLGEAIESVLAQTVAPAQIVVVDDGSTDGSTAIGGSYGDVVTLIRQANAGVSAARNRGAAEVSAEWLLFLDADDRLCPGAIEQLTARAATGACGVVYGQTLSFGGKVGCASPVGTEQCEGRVPAAARANFWKSAIATPGAAMIRADLLREVGGFHPQLSTAADRDLWIKAGTLAEFGFVPGVVIERRLHGENMSGDLDRARRQAVEVQLGVLSWCRERSVDPAFFETSPAEIIERNLLRALETRSFAAADWISAEAARLGIESPVLARARRIQAMPVFVRTIVLKVRELLHR